MSERVSSILSEAPSERVALGKHQDQALALVLLTAATATTLTTVGIAVRDGLSATTMVAATLTLALWLLWPLYRSRHRKRVAQILILALWLGSFGAIVAQGSVRSGGSLAMLATLVLAGSFLPRTSTVVIAAISLVSLAVLNQLEQSGLLQDRLPAVGWTVWILQATCMVTTLVSVLFSRYRLLAAFRDQRDAYELAVEAEQDMRASQERFLSLFQNNPAATLVVSLDTRKIVNANEAFEQLLGYPVRSIMDQDPPAFWVHPAEHLAFRAGLKAQGRVANLKARIRRSDGSEIDALVFASIVHQERERLLMTMVLDVSAEERSRRELRLSEERFSKAFNFSPLGMTITRLSDGLFVEANPANQRVIGWTQEDLKGHTSLAVGVWISQEDRDDYVQTLRREGRLQAYETHMRGKHGEVVPVRIWAEIIDIAGEPCALSFTLNVAEEKRRENTLINLAQGVAAQTGEAYFLSLAENLCQAIAAHGVVVAELTGEGLAGTLALVAEQKLQPNRPLALAHSTYSRLLASEDLTVLDLESRQLLQSTPPFDPDTVGTVAGLALRDADGSVIGVLAAVWRDRFEPGRDTRALLQIFGSRCNAELLRLHRDREIRRLQDTLEQRVQERTRQLQYLNQELESFSYSVSHDLKSPLRSIDGFMHMLKEQLDGRTTTDDDEMIERVQESVNRMGVLINDLLSLARVSQGQLQRTQVNLSELVADVVRRERDRDPEREVDVVIEPDLYANCDPRLAHIVLENLIGNAWKYSRRTPHARVEFGACQDDATGTAGFFVSDNGAGFDMARADRLFKPFTRLHSSAEFEGSGIGLATVRRIIERHSGQIKAEGKPGQGARFCFHFGSEAV